MQKNEKKGKKDGKLGVFTYCAGGGKGVRRIGDLFTRILRYPVWIISDIILG